MQELWGIYGLILEVMTIQTVCDKLPVSIDCPVLQI